MSDIPCWVKCDKCTAEMCCTCAVKDPSSPYFNFRRKTDKTKTDKPKCYYCIYMGEIENSVYVYCKNRQAVVEGSERGIEAGYFDWPYQFHPVWLKSCTGFQAKGVQEEWK